MKKIAFILAMFVSVSAFAQGGYKVGDKISDFKLTNIDGQQVSLSNYADASKGAIVMFTCNHCPYVIKNEDRINELNKKYQGKGFPVIAINSTDTLQFQQNKFASMRKRAEEKGFTYPYLVDGTQDVVKAFGATKTPEVFVLEKKGGDFYVRYTGAIDDDVENPSKVNEKYVEKAVEAILSGQSIAKTKTKSIGCGIKLRN